MTDLQEKMLRLQTISIIMSSESELARIALKEAAENPNLNVNARVLYYQALLGNMKQNLINEILNNQEFYAPLSAQTDKDYDTLPKK